MKRLMKFLADTVRDLIVFTGLIISVDTSGQLWVRGQVIDGLTITPIAFAVIAEEGSSNGVFSDTDGNFDLQVSGQGAKIIVRLVGYKTTNFDLESVNDSLRVFLYPALNSLAEVVIRPGVNPADVLINKAIENKLINDPERYAYRCDAYFKFAVGQPEDSTKMSMFNEVNPDSTSIEMKKFLSESNLFMMENLVTREFSPPDKRLETIKAHRVSGLNQSADMLLLAYQMQQFTAYGETIEILGNVYMSPLADRSITKYYFSLEDSVFQDGDTLFGISFRPQKGKTFHGLNGKLYLHNDGFALANFRASVPDSTAIIADIKQLYKRYPNKRWFPIQLDTYINLEKVIKLPLPIECTGKQYFHNVDFNPLFGERYFGPVTINAEDLIRSGEDTVWTKGRVRELSEKEYRTFTLMDSLGKEAKLDKMLTSYAGMFSGSLPIGPLNWNWSKIVGYNLYERIRVTADFETNGKISDRWNLGGYCAYAFGDKRLKYGGRMRIRLASHGGLTAEFGHMNDVFESGGNMMMLQERRQLVDIYQRYISRMDRRLRYDFSLSMRVWRTLSVKLLTSYQFIEPFDSLQFVVAKNESVILYKGSFGNVEQGAELRWAPGEKIMITQRGEIKLKGRMPIFQLRYAHSPALISMNDFTYNRFDFRMDKTFQLLNAGNLSVTLVAGAVDRAVPYSLLYNARGSYRSHGNNQFLNIRVLESFQTMRTNEFQHTQYASLFVCHDFQDYIFGKRKFSPHLALRGAALVGRLKENELYNIEVKGVKRPYFEAGIEFNNLIQGIAPLGVGMSYRLGTNALSNTIDNFAMLLTFDQTF